MYWREWLKTLLGLTVLLGVLEMLLPPGDLGKFSKLVLGLALMLAVLQPLTILLNQNLETPDLQQLTTDYPAPDISVMAEKVQVAGTRPFLQYNDQSLNKQIEGLLLTMEQIEDVSVQVKNQGEEERTVTIRITPFEDEIQNRVRRAVAGILNLAEHQIWVQAW